MFLLSAQTSLPFPFRKQTETLLGKIVRTEGLSSLSRGFGLDFASHSNTSPLVESLGPPHKIVERKGLSAVQTWAGQNTQIFRSDSDASFHNACHDAARTK